MKHIRKYNTFNLSEEISFFKRKKANKYYDKDVEDIFKIIYNCLPDVSYNIIAMSNNLPPSNKSNLDIDYSNIPSWNGFSVECKDNMYEVSIPPKISDKISTSIKNKLEGIYDIIEYKTSSFHHIIKLQKKAN